MNGQGLAERGISTNPSPADALALGNSSPQQAFTGRLLHSNRGQRAEALTDPIRNLIRAHLGVIPPNPPAPVAGLSEWRQRLLGHVSSQPGTSLVEARQAVGLQHRALLRHLVPLIDDGQIFAASTSKESGRIFLLPKIHGIESWWPQIVALRDRETALMHGALLGQRFATYTAILEQGRHEWGLNTSTARTRLRTLLLHKLVVRDHRDSALRTTVYRGVRALPPVLQMILSSRSEGHLIANDAHRPATASEIFHPSDSFAIPAQDSPILQSN